MCVVRRRGGRGLEIACAAGAMLLRPARWRPWRGAGTALPRLRSRSAFSFPPRLSLTVSTASSATATKGSLTDVAIRTVSSVEGGETTMVFVLPFVQVREREGSGERESGGALVRVKQTRQTSRLLSLSLLSLSPAPTTMADAAKVVRGRVSS